MKSIAILIPVFNTIDYTKKCLEYLGKALVFNELNDFDATIIVIDDGSTDNTSEWIKANKPDVVLLQGNGELWWSGGVNMGAQYALETLHADYLLLWNNDILIQTDYFVQLQEILEKASDDTIFGSKIYQSIESGMLWSFGGFFNPKSGKKYMLGLGKKDGPEFEKEYSVDWFTGMGTIIPAKVVRKIGYWDAANFPQYHGDNDFTYRAKLAGFKLIAHPKLKIWNDTSNTGLRHEGSFKQLIRTFTSIKSQHNLSKNLLFYKKYSTSILAYIPLFKSYMRAIGGFFKWKLLGLFNIHKT